MGRRRQTDKNDLRIIRANTGSLSVIMENTYQNTLWYYQDMEAESDKEQYVLLDHRKKPYKLYRFATMDDIEKYIVEKLIK